MTISQKYDSHSLLRNSICQSKCCIGMTQLSDKSVYPTPSAPEHIISRVITLSCGFLGIQVLPPAQETITASCRREKVAQEAHHIPNVSEAWKVVAAQV